MGDLGKEFHWGGSISGHSSTFPSNGVVATANGLMKGCIFANMGTHF